MFRDLRHRSVIFGWILNNVRLGAKGRSLIETAGHSLEALAVVACESLQVSMDSPHERPFAAHRVFVCERAEGHVIALL